MADIIRRFTTQMEVLQRLRDRLIDEVPAYTEANCFILDQPVPPDFPIGREVCTITPGGGSFVEPMFTGGGYTTLTENATTVITPMVRQVRDAPRTASRALLSQSDGLLERKWQILRALLADDFDLQIVDDQTALTRMLLREQLSVRAADPPGFTQVGQTQMLGLSITFNTPFDWGIWGLTPDSE